MRYKNEILPSADESLSKWASSHMAGGNETEREFGNMYQNLKCRHAFGLYSMDFIRLEGRVGWGGDWYTGKFRWKSVD